MSLLFLVAQVCRTFSQNTSDVMRVVQKVKGSQVRDVVTGLDIKLHNLSESFVTSSLSNCKLLSEESNHENFDSKSLLKDEWIIVDPLDGTSNYALSLPNYGYMASYLQDGYILGVAIVLPEFNQYIVIENNQSIYAQPLPTKEFCKYGTVYYAYPPKQSLIQQKTRIEIEKLIDSQSAGLYRYGSACVGLYQLLCARHMGFIGHNIRLWDALAFLPVLALNGIQVRYHINDLFVTIIASVQIDFMNRAAEILQREQGIVLKNYRSGDKLMVSAL